MGVHALIPAAIQNSGHVEAFHDSTPAPHHPHPDTASALYESYPSYASAVQQGSNYDNNQSGPSRFTLDSIRTASSHSLHPKDPQDIEQGDYEAEGEYGPIITVTWETMSRLYLLVPIITLAWLVLLVLLVTYAWPPTKKEREAGQQYPHPLLPYPFIIGIFASCTVQTIRVPIFVVVEWFGFSSTAIGFISRILHSTLHEALRLLTLPLIVPSPTSGFHSSYYLGLGWGVAEVTWGIVQGWEQLALYQEVMPSPDRIYLPDEEDHDDDEDGQERAKREGMLSAVEERDEEESDREIEEEEDEEEDVLDDSELEKKVEILERMRARRDLEQVIGVPFPNIPFPFHLLWRLDTLLLNLGLTLILSAFYFNPTPIYRHFHPSPISDGAVVEAVSIPATKPDRDASKYLWLSWVIIVLVHVGVNLAWKVVGRLGVGAVTWGALIIALGSVFAGLGCWGGLV
ncbi:hypothetical protein I314_03495 [Cryptococcus bacillisporus CA1873]|uniref:Uncharacterized protein n=1 Tax=Cryptococcus bacillisporus CA1873 TaxID=1296111 RepID=A0ABR5BAY9_CRYGA|nr:hypothetical protein I314_03495 [Cryptococcus bacillisporus CA1873]|eukprot:KIR62550.1 hypothetical protein I314_03495 [Cryptococcus gattii CA1873]